MKQGGNNRFQYNTLLVTGGAGFIGSNLAVSFKNKYPSLKVIALDNLKRRGSELNIKRLKENGIEFVHGDIRNPEDLEFNRKIDLLLECSAEPSVLAGYGESPAYLINTNLIGTINCLEMARRNKADVVFLSTSRVYPYDAINSIKTIETETRFEWVKEQDRDIPGWSRAGIDAHFSVNGPKSMYGATKLCSEIILQEYIKMYDIRGIINRCGVIAGTWQFGKVDQGVFTLWMLAHYFKRPLKYIGFGGKGKQVRDLLHVDDLFELLDLQLSFLERASGRIYTVGGGLFANLSLCETTTMCCEITGNKIKAVPDLLDRPADIKIYISDTKAAHDDFSWEPKKSARDIFIDIYSWIRENEESIKRCIVI